MAKEGARPDGPAPARARAALPFQDLGSGVGGGEPAPAGWLPLADLPLLVLVGGPGVGKSTALAALAGSGLPLAVLPERRALTARFVLAPAGLPEDLPRAARQAPVAAFRRRFPGAMAEILARLAVDPAAAPAGAPRVFDGLRGAAEVEHAAAALPRAFFAALEAPEAVRAARLLARRDPHDRPPGGQSAAAAVGELLAGESRQGEPVATFHALQRCAPGRFLIFDTFACPPREVVRCLVAAAGLWEAR